MSMPESLFGFQLSAAKIPHTHQFRFHPSRKYRADFRIDGTRLLVEIDGGTFLTKGGHNGAGFERDRIRDADAMERGWVVLHTTPRLVRTGRTLAAVEWLRQQPYMTRGEE